MTSLPLINGGLFVDNSFLENYNSCARKCEYANIQRRVLGVHRAPLTFGSAGHLALEIRYGQGPDLPSDSDSVLVDGIPIPALDHLRSRQVAALTKFFSAPQHVIPEGDWRTLNWAIEVFVKQYNDRYRTEQFNLLMGDDDRPLVEKSFAIPFAAYDTEKRTLRRVSELSETRPVDISVIYCGKIDLPVLWDTHLMVMDHKTTSVMGDSLWDSLRVSPQQVGYCWAYKKIFGTTPIGFVVNAIRSKPLPTRKPDGGWDKWWEETFQRLKEYLAPHHFDEWEANTFALLEELFWVAEKEYWPLKRLWCVGKFGKCDFYDVCYSPIHQRQGLLGLQTFMDNPWSPLNKESWE